MYHILKYPVTALAHQDRTTITIFKGARLLAIKSQYEHIMIWIEYDHDSTDTEEIEIVGVWTGKPFELKKDFKYFDTVIDYLGLVWHFYVKREHTQPDTKQYAEEKESV